MKTNVVMPAKKTTTRAGVFPLPFLWLCLGTVAALGGYLLASSSAAGLGFPLDDAWIHQTYARNLAQLGEWSYIPGQPSAGSTAPLWSLLLAVGYWLKMNPLFWAYSLGALSLLGIGWMGEGFVRQLLNRPAARIPWVGLFLIGEWHLVWAAGSGMETALYAALLLLAFWLIARSRGRSWFGVGLLVGLCVWVRPDAVTLFGPAGFVLMLAGQNRRDRLTALGWLAVGFLALFIPYLLFNLQIQGSLWPNTFYAKQAEYADLRALPIFQRIADQLKLPLIGGGLFLLPGFGWSLWYSWSRRSWVGVAAGLWFLGFALIYALQLPVTYQYGRYLMPAMPVYFVLGLAGTALLLEKGRSSRAAWVITRTLTFSLAGVWLAFYGVVAGYYARDVAIIETEMVAAARWVAVNTPPDALIAAHDIGALGYFGERNLVDLAGLISPDVIPFIRDEPQLAQWLDQQSVDYLVTFPGWYTSLPVGKTPVYYTGGQYSPQAGGENMNIYRWKP